MSQNEARSWWADVEHLREGIEGRRSGDSATLRHPEDTPSSADESVIAISRARSTPRPRRTVQITGRPAGPPAPAPRRLVEVERRRPAPRAIDRAAHRPDRLALWAVFLGFALVLVAALSAHA